VAAVNCPDYSVPRTTSTIQFQFPFAPTQLSGLVQWLDSQDITTLFQNSAGTTPVTATGQNVAYWSDKSGCNNSVSSNANIAVPLYGSGLISTFNALNFASSRMLRTAGTFAKSSNVTFVTVGVVKNTIGTWGTWWGHFAAPDHDLNAITMRRVQNNAVMNWHTNNDNSVMNLSYTVDSPVIYSGTMQNGSSMFFQQYNTASSANVTGTITQSINTAVAPIWVGASDSAGEYINGPIGEIKRCLHPSIVKKWRAISRGSGVYREFCRRVTLSEPQRLCQIPFFHRRVSVIYKFGMMRRTLLERGQRQQMERL
jgi:hypothetical protein